MKLAVMQPYLFPYIGYFQLIAAVDRFALFDDVNFIVRGWINRNRILLQGKEFLFTVPLNKASQNKLIHDTAISGSNWKGKLMGLLKHAYGKAPYYQRTISLIQSVLEKPARTIDELAFHGLVIIARYLDLNTEIIRSTRIYQNSKLKGQDRIIDICLREGADMYVNAAGGREIYHHDAFSTHGIDLRFLETLSYRYPQFGNAFVPHLSIIDFLMFNEKSTLNHLVWNFRINP